MFIYALWINRVVSNPSGPTQKDTANDAGSLILDAFLSRRRAASAT
jgi:hypothetical protein